VISPISDEMAANLMKIEEQRAKSLHKSPKKTANSLSKPSDVESKDRAAAFTDAEITGKDRQR